MPLLRNTNQPYFPDPNSPARRDCGGTFCYLLADGDTIRTQFYQTPCGGNEIEDPSFNEVTVGTDLLGGGGSFTGGTAGWTLGAGWAYGTNDVVKTAGNTNTLSWAGATMALGGFARTIFTLVRTAGSIQVGYGVGAGQNLSAPIDESGTITVDMLYNDAPDNTLVFVPSSDFAGTIDSVTLHDLTYDFWDPDLRWDLSDGMACKSDDTNASTLEQNVADYVVAGGYYVLTFTIEGWGGAGTLTPMVADVDNTQSLAITGNGEYTLYFEPTVTGVVSFIASTAWTGCIVGASISLKALRKDYTATLIDSEGTEFEIGGYFEYWLDFVTLNLAIDTLDDVAYGCMRIELFDQCLQTGDNLVSDPDFANGDFTNWIRNHGSHQYAMTAGGLEFIFEPLQGANLISNGDFATGDFTDWTAGANWSVVGNAAVHTPGSTDTLTQTVTTSAPAIPPLLLHHWIQLTIAGRTAGSITVTLSDRTSAVYNTNEVITFRLIPTIGGSVSFTITPSSDFDGSVDTIALHEATTIWSSFVTISNTPNPLIVAGNYDLEVEIVSVNPTTVGMQAVLVDIVNATGVKTFNNTVGVHTSSITDYVPGNQQVYVTGRFQVGNNTYPGRIAIDNVSAVRVEPFDAEYISACINYAEQWTDSRLLTAYCDQEAFGFEFTETEFMLQFRTIVRSLNPTYSQTTNVARYGTGDARVTYAEVEKTWLFVTDFMDESAHDALAVMIRCDHFEIGSGEADAIEYVAEPEDYAPDWRPDGDYSLAPVSLRLRLKEGGQKFNRHT